MSADGLSVEIMTCFYLTSGDVGGVAETAASRSLTHGLSQQWAFWVASAGWLKRPLVGPGLFGLTDLF